MIVNVGLRRGGGNRLGKGIARLFAAGEQGGWWDPSDFSTLFQDSMGTTPVTATTQPVGLILDKRLALARGAQQVVNGDFAAGSTGWSDASSAGGTLSFAGGNCLLTNTAGIPRLRQTLAVVANTWNRFVFDATGITSGTPVLTIGSIAGGTDYYSNTALAAGVGQTVWFFATGASAFVNFSCNTAGVMTVDNVGCQQVSGNHRTQATAASRPTLQVDGNGGFYLNYDGVDDFMVTAAIDLTAVNKLCVFAGIYKTSDAALGVIIETASGGPSPFTLTAPFTAASPSYGWYINGGAAQEAINAITYTAPIGNVLTAQLDKSTAASMAAQCSMRVNGVAAAAPTGTGPVPIATLNNEAIYFGRRTGTTLPFNGREYGNIMLARAPTTTEITQTERYIGSKMGITL